MKRYASHAIFCSPEKISKLSVVELNEIEEILDVFDINSSIAEPSNTVFYDGIIASFPVSVSKSGMKTKINLKNYQYIDVNAINNGNLISETKKKLLIDFGTENLLSINLLLKKLSVLLKDFNPFEIIEAATTVPGKITGIQTEISKGMKVKLTNWKLTTESENSILQIYKL